jgi:hypothetical protein
MATDDRLNDLFNISKSETDTDINNIKQALAETNATIDEEVIEDNKNIAAIDMIHEREQRIKQLVDLQDYDKDVDTIFVEALDAFRTAFSVATDLPGNAAAEMMNAANGFCKIALDAKNSKLKSRLDAVSLALKKQQIDQKTESKEKDTSTNGESVFLDRNDILANLTDIMKNQNKN